MHGEIEDPLRRSHEWTIVLNCSFNSELITSSTSAPQRILTQQTQSKGAHAIDDASSRRISNRNELRLEINNGYLRVSLVHDDPISMIQVQTTEPIAINTWTQIAVSYDGTNRAYSLRVSLDGEYVGLNYLADSLIRDFVGETSKEPVEGQSYELQLGDSTTSGHFWELEDIEVYRTVLSTPELIGLIENAPWQDWQDFSEPEQLAWIEHYARRIDPHWRYERETLRWDTLETPWKESISRTEVERQWQHLIEHATSNMDRSKPSAPGAERPAIQANDRGFTESRLQSLAKRFIDRDWDRRAMLLDLLLSPEWIAIAIDSVE